MSIATLLKTVLGLYLLSSYKSVPGAYFVRFYYHCSRLLLVPFVTGKNTKNIKRLQSTENGCFALARVSTYVSPLECDFYFHKNNATYFVEMDVSRAKLMCSIFQKLFLTSKRFPFVPVANVFTNFLKELKPFQSYDVVSSILGWDEKWIYVISRFTRNNDKILCSLSLTKYVLKDGRKTIPPVDALTICGLYNEQVEAISKKNMHVLKEQCGFHETTPLEQMTFDYIEL
ncbi:hypothetical protein NCAS_0I01220 [Naumovozyma castellii]|uniref:Thioesterase domain-containing protein n=1 Tax=Naumovozyma castellii TaxID=27288 RepID=G0VJV8_NAUCA|nr:hypothetical protein NCAS_0I01220 [Naumovozyma castellii CBS 4309]CCC71790.1 hypothetical protein NCAS_0I01220 [Naumovozyma castellii CBS 4309]